MQARAGIVVGSGSHRNSKVMFPQWQLPRMSTAARGVGLDRHVSLFRDDNGLADHILTLNRFLREGAVGVKHELNGFDKISAGFFEVCGLRVCARQFFNESNIAFMNAAIDGGQLHTKRKSRMECLQYSAALAQDA